MLDKVKRDGPLRIDWVKSDAVENEMVGLTILPGRKDYSRSTDSDVAYIIDQEVKAIVPLITDDELHDFGVDDLIDVYLENGLDVFRLPIKDQMTSSNQEMKELVYWIDDHLKKGDKVLIHCVGGLGRSGMVAASYLKYKNKGSMEAISDVRHSRSPRAVESIDQENFVKSFS